MKRLAAGAVIVLILVVAYFVFTGRNRNLRGWWKQSNDGRTYLVIEDDEGGDGDNGRQCFLDGKPWPHKVGERGEIQPGGHEIGCLAKVGFTVEAGTEFTSTIGVRSIGFMIAKFAPNLASVV